MTKAQIKKIDALCYKLEELQHEVDDKRVAERLGNAKRWAMDALALAEAEPR